MQPEKQYDEFSKPVAVAYIGKKEFKRDTLCRSGAVWSGFGDVQHVDARVASRLLVHKDVFIPAKNLPDLEKQMKASIKQDLIADTEKSQTQLGDTGGASVDSSEPTSEGDSGNVTNLEPIKNAILGLDRANDDHFKKNGEPKLPAVRSLLPADFEVTIEQVKLAYTELGGE